MHSSHVTQNSNLDDSKIVIEAGSSVILINNNGSYKKTSEIIKKVSDVSDKSNSFTRKKRAEAHRQPQLITIQSLYDNDDEVTVHPLNLPTHWKNYDLNAR